MASGNVLCAGAGVYRVLMWPGREAKSKGVSEALSTAALSTAHSWLPAFGSAEAALMIQPLMSAPEGLPWPNDD